MDKYLEEEKALNEAESMEFFSKNGLNNYPKPYNFEILLETEKMQETHIEDD